VSTLADHDAKHSGPIDDWTPLDDPSTRRLAEACLLRCHGRYSAAEVAQVVGVCADTLHALLGVGSDVTG
jgi:hypothetical protein